MGTSYTVHIITPRSKKLSISKIQKKVKKTLNQLNQEMSTYILDSQVSQFNQYLKTDWFPISKDLSFILSEAIKISHLTNGIYDVTLAPIIEAWGFDKKETDNTLSSIITSSKTSDQHYSNWLSSKKLTWGYQYLDVDLEGSKVRKKKPSIKVNLSSIAKGYAVDKIAQYLDQIEVQNYMVEIGGELIVRGLNQLGKKWNIALEHPNTSLELSKKIFKVLPLSNTAIATSGSYRNFISITNNNYAHIIDGQKLKPIKLNNKNLQNLMSVSVLHQSCTIADAWATALMATGFNKAKVLSKKYKLSVVFLLKEKGASTIKIWSNNLPNDINSTLL